MHAAHKRRHHRTGVLPPSERRLAAEIICAVVATAGLFLVVPALLHGPTSFAGMLCPAIWIVGSAAAIGRITWHLARLTRRSRVVDRATHGRCTRCGYDLTNLSSRRCPECGTYVHRMMLALAPKQPRQAPTLRH